MGGFLGIPRERLPIAVAMVIALAAALAFLQGRFDQSDVKKGIGIALAHRAEPGGPTVFDAIVMPERTPLIRLAERCGATTIFGREMMRGQIDRMVDFFSGTSGNPGAPAGV